MKQLKYLSLKDKNKPPYKEVFFIAYVIDKIMIKNHIGSILKLNIFIFFDNFNFF